MNDCQVYTLDSDGLTLGSMTFRTETDDATKDLL